MAESKRKKLDKRVPQVIQSSTSCNAICFRCGTGFARFKGHFSLSNNPIHRGIKYLPFCYECVEEMFESYVVKYDNEREAMRRICMKLDIYWSHTLANMVESQPSSATYVKRYLSKSNMNRFLDKTFDDTLEEERAGTSSMAGYLQQQNEAEDLSQDSTQENVCKEPTIEDIPPDVVQFWGPGLTPRQYIEYNNRFLYLKAKYPDDKELTLGEETLLRKLSAIEVDDNYERAAGKSSDKNTAIINTLVGSINLKPAQKGTEAEKSGLDGMPLGVGIRKWEEERPLPPTDKSLSDVNGLIKGITTWFFGHTSKSVGLKNSHCQLYEEAMETLRVNPECYEEDDDDSLLADLFSDKRVGESVERKEEE